MQNLIFLAIIIILSNFHPLMAEDYDCKKSFEKGKRDASKFKVSQGEGKPFPENVDKDCYSKGFEKGLTKRAPKKQTKDVYLNPPERKVEKTIVVATAVVMGAFFVFMFFVLASPG